MPAQSKEITPEGKSTWTEFKIITSISDTWDTFEEMYDYFCSDEEPGAYLTHADVKKLLNAADNASKDMQILMKEEEFHIKLKTLEDRDTRSFLGMMFEDCISDEISDAWNEDPKRPPLDVVAMGLLQIFLREQTHPSSQENSK